MKHLFKLSKIAFGVLAFAMTIALVFGYGDIFTVVGGGTLAMASGAGENATETVSTEVTDAKSSELLDDAVSKVITDMKPAATPLDTIMRQIGLTVKIDSWKTDFYEVDVRGINDTIKTEFDTSASGTVDANQPSVHTISVNKPYIWTIDDIILVHGVTGGGSMDLRLHVVSKNASAYTLGVVALNGVGDSTYNIPDIPLNTKITRIGNAKAELDAQTTPYSNFPQKSYNYCQIHMAQVEESVFNKLHGKEVKWDIMDHKLQSIYDMRRAMELTSIFGYRAKTYDPIGEEYKYTSGGLTQFVSGSLEYSTTGLNEDTFINWTRDIFTGNSGSDTRILFAGKKLMAYMSALPSITRQIDSGNVETKWGIKFSRIETNFGTLLVKHHNLFNDVGWEEKGLVLDINNIERHIFKPMEVRELDLIKTGTRMANAYVIDETFCLITRYTDTHSIIAPASS